jgi:DNA polymerase III delta prime subunit
MLTSELLLQVAQQDALAHGYLFSGNNTEYAKELVRRCIDGLHIDQADELWIEPAGGEISIAAIRDVTVYMGASPWNSLYKIAVLQEAHTMGKEAQAAFLKLLEEPHGNVVFFLVSEYPYILLDTVRSRLQEFSFYNVEYVPNAHVQKEFETLCRMSLVERFVRAKAMADAPETISHILHTWLVVVRHTLLQELSNGSRETAAQLTRAAIAIQRIRADLAATNASVRLGLERIMLDLPAL